MRTIGSKVKQLRHEKYLTLQQMAERVGRSAAYISQIENDKASPSIATLKSIAHSLDVRIVDFFLEEEKDDPVVLEKKHWPQISLPDWRADIKQMVRGVEHRQMQPFYTVIEPGGGTIEEYSHQGEEFGLVLEGELILTVGKTKHSVPAGSSFYYTSTQPHAWTNENNVPCKVLWVVTPPSW